MERGIIILLLIIVLVSACTTTYRSPSASELPPLKEEEAVTEEIDGTGREDDDLSQPNIQEDELPAIDIPPPVSREFNVVIGHTFYNPNRFIVKKGDTIRFLARAAPGTGSHIHGITIDEYGINQAVTNENNFITIEFVADRAGTFSIWCKTCWDGPFGRGHPDIRATLVVEE